jgi:cytochrome P450
MKFHDWEIPPGVSSPSYLLPITDITNTTTIQTPVGMTSVHIHQNPSIFPDPLAFKPSRWLEKRPPGAPPLDRYLVSFSKGSRQCAGLKYVLSSGYEIGG